MHSQRGGSFKVNGYVALALLAVALASAVYGYYQHTHRVIEITVTAPRHLPSTRVADKYVTHAFPESRNVCSGFDTICWIRI